MNSKSKGFRVHKYHWVAEYEIDKVYFTYAIPQFLLEKT